MKHLLPSLLTFAFFTLYANAQHSPYVTRVFDYSPAPGQFVNEMPKYVAGDTQETMTLKAQQAIAYNNQSMITLGGYGGYVVVGFDHPIVNVPGQSDFKVLGNAFWAASSASSTRRRGGSSEPGIVMVAADANGNGIPDDPWYELAGSEYAKATTVKHYEITYYRPDENKVKTPNTSYPYLNDTTYLRWTTNGYGNGYIYRNSFHAQAYYPQWTADDKLTFSGSKLADNYIDESGTGSYFVQYAYDKGYADNAPNDDNASNMNIEWAVDDNGKAVHLSAIHFVKIYTAVNQYCGWLGESSTEVTGITDLHPEIEPTAIGHIDNDTDNRPTRILDLQGQCLMTLDGKVDVKSMRLPKGIYIIQSIDTQGTTQNKKITIN